MQTERNEIVYEGPVLPAPTAAPKKKGLGGWAIAGLVVAGLLIFGAVDNGNDSASSASSTSTVDAPTGLVSYAGTTVDDMVNLTIGTPEWQTLCDLTPSVGYDVARQMFVDADPQIGSDAYEGAVFDGFMAAC
jgi:hypothetical protein